MKKERLDQILIRLGYADEDRITKALARQRAHGGRIGMHLVQMGVITEEQLVEALADQFSLKWTVPSIDDVPVELVRRMPPMSILEHETIPLEWDERDRILTLAVADPGDRDVIALVKEAFGARRVVLTMAPERVLQAIGRRLVDPESAKSGRRGRVELPELFEVDPKPKEVAGSGQPALVRVLMVAGGASYRNFLPPILGREGCDVTVVSDVEDAENASTGEVFDRVLVSKEMVETYSRWVKDGLLPSPIGEVSVFSGVAEALLENPAPYASLIQSLRNAVQAIAEIRGNENRDPPPHGLIADDLEALGRRYGLRRIALDGLHLASHLLVPTDSVPGRDTSEQEPFSEMSSSLELAARLRFPWRLDSLIAASHALHRGRTTPSNRGSWTEETHLAAQMLALVWFRHVQTSRGDESISTLGAALRGQAGRLASLEVIETYLRLMDERDGAAGAGDNRQVLLVGEGPPSRALAGRLGRVGCRTITADDIEDARSLVERRPPAAVVFEGAMFNQPTETFAGVLNSETPVLLYVLTDSTDPASTLALLDAGADDVFGPPHDFDLIAARISRAVRQRPRAIRGELAREGYFSARLDVFSFLDLAQMLSQARKTARIGLIRSDGERAAAFMEHGVIVHAVCGELSGSEAVYRVIAWQDQGEFTVYPGAEPPETTIHRSTEAVLMEGCRLLDEAGLGLA